MMNEQVVPERRSSSVETPTPGVLATPSAPTTPTSDLPPIAADADDLRVIKQAVDDAASVGGGLWLSYLFVLFYLAIAAGAVTHADLFFENPVKLPFLNVELPLLAFFFVAPILFLVVHAYTLLHLVMLTDKAKRYHQALYDQIGEKNGLSREESQKRKSIRDDLRRQLPSNIFIQFLVGPADLRRSAFGWLLRAVAWVTLVIAPVLLLLLMQVQFLPFHSSFITWTHRTVLLADLGLIWWLWGTILSGREGSGRHRWASWAWSGLGVFLSVGVFLFSWAAATFPGEWQEAKIAGPVSLHEWVFDSKINPTTHRRMLPFSSTLVLSGLNVYEGLNIDDPKKVEWRDFVFRARGRDLKGAILDLASLPKIDLLDAQLQGASLDLAQLQGASLAGAQLQGASLIGARLQGASLAGARLQGASLDLAQLEGASLDGAQFQGALLAEAQLQGALLAEAQLQGASLDGAQLQGALLAGAQLQGASLAGAQLQGASLRRASLTATDLSGALLWRSNGNDANIVSVKLSHLAETWGPYYYKRSEDPDYSKPGEDQIQRWSDEVYGRLLTTIGSLPPGYLRDEARRRILVLQCSGHPMLTSCDPSDPSVAPPPGAAEWRKSLEGARVDDAAYDKALMAVLKTLVCSGDANATYVLRGVEVGRLEANLQAPALVDFFMSKDCPVSTFLTDEDKARLLRIKQNALRRQDAIKKVGQ